VTVYRHLDFEPPGWGELDHPPITWPTYAQRILALDPLAYWRLNDLPGGSAVDHTGNLAPGAYSASVQHQQPGPLAYDSDGGIRLNGTDGSVEFPDSALLNNATRGTILFWINYHAPAVEADGGVVARWSNTRGGGFAGWMVWVDRSAAVSGAERTLTFAASVSAGASGRIEGDTDLITPGVWDSYAVTFAGGQEFRMYKNGELIKQKATNTAAFASTSHRLRLGRTGGTIGHLPASLDEVAVFDTVLEANKIKELYDVGRGQSRLPQTGDNS